MGTIESSDECGQGHHEACRMDWLEGSANRPVRGPELAVRGILVRCGCPCHDPCRAPDPAKKAIWEFMAGRGRMLTEFGGSDLRMLDENIRHAVASAWLAGFRAAAEKATQ